MFSYRSVLHVCAFTMALLLLPQTAAADQCDDLISSTNALGMKLKQALAKQMGKMSDVEYVCSNSFAADQDRISAVYDAYANASDVSRSACHTKGGNTSAELRQMEANGRRGAQELAAACQNLDKYRNHPTDNRKKPQPPQQEVVNPGSISCGPVNGKIKCKSMMPVEKSDRTQECKMTDPPDQHTICKICDAGSPRHCREEIQYPDVGRANIIARRWVE